MKKKNFKKRKDTKTALNLIKPFILSLLLMAFMISCSDDDTPNPASETIAVLLTNGSQVTLFTEALDRIDFLDNLHGTKKYTVLAPNDDAFEAFLEENDYDDVDDVPEAELKKIILNHIIPTQELSTDDLLDMDKEYVESSAEYALFVGIDDDDISINGNTQMDDEVIDVVASNGVIHLVNSVITIPTIVTFLELDAQFSDFYKGLTTGTPNYDFISNLKGLETDDESDAPFTVFAPNNEAIETLLDTDENWEKIEDIDESTLIPILKHHIIITKAISKEDIEDGLESTETWEGDSLLFTESEDNFTITDGSGNENIKILTFDIKTRNGIIHIIESVLMPDTDD